MPFRAVVHGFYAVGTHFALPLGGFYAVETHTRDSGGNLNDVGAGDAVDAGKVEAHDIEIGRQVAGALLADNIESASETTQNLSETIRA